MILHDSGKNNKYSLSVSQASQQYFCGTYLKQIGEVFPNFFSLFTFQARGKRPSSDPFEIRHGHVTLGSMTREWKREWSHRPKF